MCSVVTMGVTSQDSNSRQCSVLHVLLVSCVGSLTDKLMHGGIWTGDALHKASRRRDAGAAVCSP